MKKADNIRFDSKGGRFYGISESDVKQWKEQYPYIDFDDPDKLIEEAGQYTVSEHIVPNAGAIGTGRLVGLISISSMEHVRENPREILEYFFFKKDFTLSVELSDKQKKSIGRNEKKQTADKSISQKPAAAKKKKQKSSDRYLLIAALQELHGIGTDKIKLEPLTSKELERELSWNQPKVSREMKAIFGENPMKKYKQCFMAEVLSGFMKKLEDGTFEVNGIVKPEQE